MEQNLRHKFSGAPVARPLFRSPASPPFPRSPAPPTRALGGDPSSSSSSKSNTLALLRRPAARCPCPTPRIPAPPQPPPCTGDACRGEQPPCCRRLLLLALAPPAGPSDSCWLSRTMSWLSASGRLRPSLRLTPAASALFPRLRRRLGSSALPRGSSSKSNGSAEAMPAG